MAPQQYGIKVIWKDPDGWHKLQCEGVPMDGHPAQVKGKTQALNLHIVDAGSSEPAIVSARLPEP